ncbi:MAG TPA: signal peptidase I [Vicinamibacteria bacterium]|nr:signal peptidase I [Vicinamibacteria bacterium]
MLKVTVYKIDGDCMEPTIQIDERILVRLRSHETEPPNRGDIIAYHFPQPPRPGGPDYPYSEFLRRVIGLPGDRVRIKDNRVYINGEPLEDRYVFFKDNSVETWVPGDHYFIMGENRNTSRNSDCLDLVPDGLIVGKALVLSD